MGLAYFEYNGKKSTDFGLMIDPEFSLVSPEYDVTLEEISGVDGDIATDNKRYKGLTREIPVFFDSVSNLNQSADEVSNWLKTNAGWHELTFSDNPNFVYQALHYEQYDIKKTLQEYSKTIINFRLKPYKFYQSGLTEIQLTNGQTLNNIGSRPARPLIKLVGDGDMTLTIGDQTINLQAVDTGIIIDILADTVVNINGRIPEWTKLYTYPLPKLPVGDVTVAWTGAESVSMIPRWEALLP
ncbi:distal tail protein Dit [Marinilactibacillus psychrotolerans]|uniref:distal tail protein Dit n=1 Tax=Marinilactibacillus psychrotolerans TaxID=191770 RepID=UPI0024C445C5|nr:distal tail protein Dit [Marinilactibacillus psychrotolerans]